MNNFDRLNEIIKYIEINLTDEISMEKICQILCVNEYTLYRIFKFITGISITEYIRNRRLSMAGLELINSKVKIIDLSIKYGYDSPISFSRAFKKFHGIKPSEVKQNSKYLKNFPPFTFKNDISDNKELDFKIQQKKALNFYSISKKCNLQDIKVVAPSFWKDIESSFYLCNLINNFFLFLIIINIVSFIIVIANVVILEAVETSPALRSKHSAEHMMVNFLQINKRLPKNIEEVKKSSRFSPECGSRELIKGIAEDFVRSIIATIFTAIAYGIISHFSSNSVIIFIWLLSTYYSLRFIVGKLITKYGILNFAIKPLNKVLTNIIQCVNTTANVKDKDIAMAYYVSKAWLQIVYPEFYNGNDDSWNKYLKLIK